VPNEDAPFHGVRICISYELQRLFRNYQLSGPNPGQENERTDVYASRTADGPEAKAARNVQDEGRKENRAWFSFLGKGENEMEDKELVINLFLYTSKTLIALIAHIILPLRNEFSQTEKTKNEKIKRGGGNKSERRESKHTDGPEAKAS
jgi:hypothetical protein